MDSCVDCPGYYHPSVLEKRDHFSDPSATESQGPPQCTTPTMSSLQPLPEPCNLRNVLDVLIIGAGPAGLSAALALGRVSRSAMVFDSREYRNEASEHAHTLPMHDHENPAEMRAKMRKELQHKYKTIIFADIAAVTARETCGVFEVIDKSGKSWKGRKMILATGSYDVLPSIPGFGETWGKGIIHCLFCRGFEEAQTMTSGAAFLVPTEPSTADVENILTYSQLMFQFTSSQTVLMNGNATNASLAKVSAVALSRGFRIQPKTIQNIQYLDPLAQTQVEYSDGTKETFDLIFYSPPTRLQGDMVRQLGLETTETGNVKVLNCVQGTSLRGVFAAGDCATDVKKVAVAVGQGVSATIGANVQLVEEDLESDL